jgi:hypothetical protein
MLGSRQPRRGRPRRDPRASRSQGRAPSRLCRGPLVHHDGVPGIYRISQNTICVELYANKIVDGKVQKVVVMRNTWDRACWRDMQSMIARIFGQIADLPNAPSDDAVRVH